METNRHTRSAFAALAVLVLAAAPVLRADHDKYDKGKHHNNASRSEGNNSGSSGGLSSTTGASASTGTDTKAAGMSGTTTTPSSSAAVGAADSASSSGQMGSTNTASTANPTIGSSSNNDSVTGSATGAASGTGSSATAGSDAGLAPVNPHPPVSAVQHALLSDSSIAENAKNIDVTAERGRIVLRGNVPTGQVRNEIKSRAEQAASGYKVDDELKVTGKGRDKDHDKDK
jgi:hypothetical protein